jgi:hypothetical protein
VAAALLTLLTGAVALAAPAAAAQDPAAPRVTVLRGPSCDPGGLRIEVVAGSAGYDVRLATTRRPGGEDETRLAPGQRAVLTTDDVAWGETIDPRLEYTALDGSGSSFVDQLTDWTMTRPSRADCAAIGTPASPAARTSAVIASGAAASDGAAGRTVAAGRWITVRGSGFTPGESVTVHERGRSAVLGRGMAGPDGSALVALQVPGSASGPTRLEVVGVRSRTTAGLQLQVAAQALAGQQVAAQQTPAPARERTSWPALAALLSLVTAGAGVVGTGRRAGRALVPGRPLRRRNRAGEARPSPSA